MTVCAFVAPYLMPATLDFVAAAAHIPGVEHRAWAVLMALDRFTPPARRWAVGAVYLRGPGSGIVTAVQGLNELQRELGHLVVVSSLQRVGAPASGPYEGDGYVIVRDEDTAVVSDAVRRVVSGISIEPCPQDRG